MFNALAVVVVGLSSLVVFQDNKTAAISAYVPNQSVGVERLFPLNKHFFCPINCTSAGHVNKISLQDQHVYDPHVVSSVHVVLITLYDTSLAPFIV